MGVRLPPRVEEEAVMFEAAQDGTVLEGRRALSPDGVLRGRAVVCHPHPLHGGTMQNKVVTSATRAAYSAGYATLRFNFRGVGKSGGVFGGGVDELLDVRGALETLQTVGAGSGGVRALVGFSFGSMVSALGLREGLEIDVAVLIGLPLDGWDIAPVPVPVGGVHVIVGEHDEFCSVASAERWVSGHDDSGVTLTVVEGTDHFFGGRLGVMSRAVYTALGGEPGGPEQW